MDTRLFDLLPIGVMALDARRRVVAWNQWLTEHTSITPAHASGRTLGELFPNLINPRFDMAVDQALQGGGPQILSQTLHHYLIPIEVPHLVRHGLGRMRQHVHIATAGHGDDARVLVSIIDVTSSILKIEALTDIAQRLENDVNRDPLTHLFNRRFVWEWLEHQHKQALRYTYPIAAMMLDIDHFKAINDRHGHLIGDRVLQDFARLLTQKVREADIVARFGGEEFVILLPRCDGALAADVAKRIVGRTREASLGDLSPGEVTCSAGVALFNPSDPLSTSDLLREADRRLYQAKANGRDRAVCQDETA
ncbi:MAG: diguanylate cyclase [Betaproteobacteria bacterium]|nr:diguanylate cyclase [Betaproteobacteria bacterium]